MSAKRTVKREFPPVPEYHPKDGVVDPYLSGKARAQRAREAMVACAEIRLLAEKVKECYRREGVNHYKNCEEFTRAYVARISAPTVAARPVEMSDLE